MDAQCSFMCPANVDVTIGPRDVIGVRSGHHIPTLPSGGSEETRAQVSEAVKQDSFLAPGPGRKGGSISL